MKKAARLWAGIALAALAAAAVLGFFSWEVTRPVQRFLRDSSWGRQGWFCTVERARWTPWNDLELSGVRLQTPAGGKVTVERVFVTPRLFSLRKGRLVTDWDLEEIRMDPGSWGIRKPLAQELLSAGPVAARGFARLSWRPNELLLEQFSLEGSLLRVQAEGWLKPQRQAHLILKGSLSRPVLEGMKLLPPVEGAPSWEPFDLALDGGLQAPALRFQSRFLTLMLNQPLEKNP